MIDLTCEPWPIETFCGAEPCSWGQKQHQGKVKFQQWATHHAVEDKWHNVGKNRTSFWESNKKETKFPAQVQKVHKVSFWWISVVFISEAIVRHIVKTTHFHSLCWALSKDLFVYHTPCMTRMPAKLFPFEQNTLIQQCCKSAMKHCMFISMETSKLQLCVHKEKNNTSEAFLWNFRHCVTQNNTVLCLFFNIKGWFSSQTKPQEDWEKNWFLSLEAHPSYVCTATAFFEKSHLGLQK